MLKSRDMKSAVSRWLCVLGVLAVPIVGCDENSGAGGTGGSGGTSGDGGTGGSASQVFPCTEQGIRDAIAVGGGPHTFECDGPTTVVTEGEIVIDNDVTLDGGGNLAVDGNQKHRVFSVPEGVTAELIGFAVANGSETDGNGGGIRNRGTLTLTHSTVSGNTTSGGGGGILNYNEGTLTLTNSTVSDNSATEYGGGINNGGTLTLTNSTVSGNSFSQVTTESFGGGISNYAGTVTLINSTVSDNSGDGIFTIEGPMTLTNTLVANDCGGAFLDVSGGGNLESPGDTCGFDHPTDQVNVSAENLKLGPLADNGGPTMTHALLPGSVAIDAIPADACEVDEDQRGVTRPQGPACDVGALEVQPGD
jgi:hypothetical protein